MSFPRFGTPEWSQDFYRRHGMLPMAGGERSLTLEDLGLSEDTDLSEIGEALRKAAITTGISADALLAPEQADRFISKLTDADPLSQAIRIEPHVRVSGSIEKIGIASGIIRAATENADDGYRAEPTFGTVPYQLVSVRLPWEITLQFLRRNIEGQSVEDRIWNLMTGAFGRDLTRLDLLGDTTSGDASLSIDNGWLKYFAANASGNIHRVNTSNASLGVTWPNKKTLFSLLDAMPEKYRGGALSQDGGSTSPLRWLAAPSVVDDWTEYLTDRNTAAGDSALGAAGNLVTAPLGIPFLRIPQMPTNRIILVNPKNLVRAVGGEIERYRVGPETDWELATRRKRGYIFFLDRDAIVEEDDAVVDGYNLGT